MDRVTALHCGGCSNRSNSSCARILLKQYKILSKLNCVSFVIKNWESELFRVARKLLTAIASIEKIRLDRFITDHV